MVVNYYIYTKLFIVITREVLTNNLKLNKMKKLINTTLITVLLFVLIINQSCSKKNDAPANTVTEQVSNNLKIGSWSITKFEKNGIDSTAIFSGVKFIFEANNIAISVDNTNTSVNGTWSIRRIPTSDDDDDDDGDDGDDDGLDHGNNNANNNINTQNNTNQVFSVDNLELVFNYNYTNYLINLNNKWKLVFQSQTKIELASYNNLNLIDAYLTIEKN